MRDRVAFERLRVGASSLAGAVASIPASTPTSRRRLDGRRRRATPYRRYRSSSSSNPRTYAAEYLDLRTPSPSPWKGTVPGGESSNQDSIMLMSSKQPHGWLDRLWADQRFRDADPASISTPSTHARTGRLKYEVASVAQRHHFSLREIFPPWAIRDAIAAGCLLCNSPHVSARSLPGVSAISRQWW